MNDARAARGTDHTIHIGFIGCGGNARGHMRSLGNVPGARIVGVCDVVPETAQQAAGQTGAQPYTEYNALLERDDLDAVYISLPVFAHGAPEMAVIERGLPMLVEKPVALDMATAREIETAVTKANLLTCVGYQLRYRGSAEAAKRLLSAHDAGPLGIVHGSYWCGTGRQHGATWRTQRSKSGGQILEQATHTLDMMRFLAGEVDEVFAYFGRAILGEGHGDAPDVHGVAKPHDFGKDDGAGSADVLRSDYRNGRRYARDRFRPTRHRGDIELCQLLDGELLQVLWLGPVVLRPGP